MKFEKLLQFQIGEIVNFQLKLAEKHQERAHKLIINAEKPLDDAMAEVSVQTCVAL